MLKGIFKYEQRDYYDKPIGHITIKVNETDKCYSFELLENTTRLDYDHFILLFKGKNKTRINKLGGGHAMRVWNDKQFTIYPFQAGIPFYFVKEEKI